MSQPSERSYSPREPLRPHFGASTAEATPISLSGEVSTILSHETIVRRQIGLCSLRPGLRVLEVGVGTGYLAATIAGIVGDPGLVHGIDVFPGIVEHAGANLRRVGLDGVHLRTGDGLSGWPGEQVFDRIVFSCAVYDFPWHALRQLDDAGIMVVPLSRGWPIEGLLMAVRRMSGSVDPVAVSAGRFIPAVGQPLPSTLMAYPAPPFLPGMECQVLLSGPGASADPCIRDMEWRTSEAPIHADLGESALMRCAALLQILYPASACFLGAKGLAPLCAGVYQAEPFGIACAAFSLDPPDPNRFGPIFSLGDDAPRQNLLQVIALSSRDPADWLSQIDCRWSETSPWCIR